MLEIHEVWKHLGEGVPGKEERKEEGTDGGALRLSDGPTEPCLPSHPEHVQFCKAHHIGLQVINMGL